MDLEPAPRLGTDPLHRPVGVEGGVQGPLRVVGVGDGGAEDGHHIVADMLVHPAAIARDDAVDGGEIPVEEVVGGLGTQFVREAREAREVGEQHRDLAQLAFHGRVRRVRGRGGGIAILPIHHRDGVEELLAVAEGGDAELLQVLGRERAKQLRVDVIVG
jgi:hypothetical protein